MKHQPDINKKESLKQGSQLLFFLLLMLLTFYTIFRKNDIGNILSAIKKYTPYTFFRPFFVPYSMYVPKAL